MHLRLSMLPFRGTAKPVLLPPITSSPSLQIRHKTANVAPSAKAKSWSKNQASKKKAAPTGSNNPFLQGMNFDSSDSRIALARGILFSQRPLRGLRLNPQDQIRHETIHRAWLLFQKNRRRAKIGKLRVLESSIARTMKVLRETDSKLYDVAVSGTREVEKRFPLVMRIPTETLPSQWWNYKWTASNIKGVGGVAKTG